MNIKRDECHLLQTGENADRLIKQKDTHTFFQRRESDKANDWNEKTRNDLEEIQVGQETIINRKKLTVNI